MMNTQLISTYRVVSRWASGIVIAIGLLVLMGWLFKIPTLTSILPGLATMKANSALAFVLASISLWHVIGEDRDQSSNHIAIVCAAITMLIGLLTLGEHIFGQDFGVDQLLFKDELTPQNAYPGRMSPATAMNFFLLGCALLVVDNRWSNWLNESLTITALMIAGVAVIGYIYGVSSLYKIGLYSSMAVHTAVTFIVLCVGILSARPERGLFRILITKGAAGILVRRLLPAAIGLPIVLGWLILRGQRLGEYDTAFGIALFALLNLIIFSGLIRWNADMLHQAEVKRIRAQNDLLDNEKRSRQFFENMHEAFVIQEIMKDKNGRPIDLRFLDLNPAAERILGRPRSELIGRTSSEIAGQGDPEGLEMASRVASTGMSINMVRSSPGLGRSFESFTYSLGSEIVATLSLDITERKKAEDALREKESYAHSLLNLSRKLEQAQTYSETLNAALDQVKTVLGYRNVWTYLLSEDRQSLRLLTTTGELSQMITNDFPTLPIKGDRFLEEIAAGKEIVLVEDARTDPRTNKDIVAQLGNRTIVNVPIVLMDRHLGAFGTGSFGEEGVRVPTSTQLDYLHSLASHMAVTLDRIHLLLERKHAEEQNRFLANLVASVSDAIIAVDLQQNIQSWNIGAEAMYGWKEDEVLGRPAKEILVTDFLEANRELVTKQIMEQGNWSGEVLQLRRDGTRIPALSSVALYKDSEGKPAGIVAVNRDITDRKQSEEEIRKLNEGLEQRVADRTAALSHANSLLQILLDHMPDQIYFKDAQSRFIRNSMSQAKALGLSDPAEAVGKSDFDFFPHAQQSFDKEQEIIRSGKPLVDEEERVVWPDGRETWVSTTKMPLLDQAGQIIGTFGISRDITDRKRAEIALQKAKLEMEAANKELEAFSYSVSHDLRAPLRSVDGFSQALLEDYGEMLPPDGRNFLERIRSSAQRMAELIDDLLNLSKVTRAAMKLVPVDLSQIAQGIAAELQNTHRERKVNFNITPNLKVHGDPNLLRIVLENLLNNAWKFTSKQEQAEIEVGSKSENGETFYFIRDNGAGFDMAYVGKLFGAFQRLHAMTEYSGTGIGLATVQRIINRHGGRIWAEGVVDQGATFFFTLPALEHVQPQAATIEKDSLDTRVREII